MRNELPADVVWRRDKIGWAIPEPAWFGSGGPLAPWVDDTLRGSPLVQSMVRTLGIDAPAAPLAVRLRLLNLAVWQRLFFDEPGRPGRRLGRTMARPGD